MFSDCVYFLAFTGRKLDLGVLIHNFEKVKGGDNGPVALEWAWLVFYIPRNRVQTYMAPENW